jgi:uncharacterized RDD family membrane protein YckC
MPNSKNSQTALDVVARLPRPGFFKRILVIFYDGFLWLGVIFMASLIFLLIPDSLSSANWVRGVKTVYLLGVSFLFYGWFWTHGGQTLGMRVWHLHLVNEHGKYIGWRKATLRFALAAISWLPLGLGYTWMLLSPTRSTWHDMMCKTSIVRIAPKAGSRK